MMYRWHVVGRGLAGWHVCGVDADGNSVSGSGGDLEDRSWPSGFCAGYVSEAVEGALVYDGEEADDGAFIDFVVSGPMVDPKLSPDGVRRFGETERRPAARMLVGLQGAYAVMAAAAQDERYGGLDSVGVGVYERLLRGVPGVKIGHVRGGKVVWEGA